MLVILAFILLIYFCSDLSLAISNHPLLLIVSLDGLRYDFIKPNVTPNIWQLAKNGVFAPHGISPQVNTVTTPNHQSISTGLYEESHGIIDNHFYDPVLEEFFDHWNIMGNATAAKRSLLSHWFVNGGEPIWRTNMQISGHLSGSLHWPLGDAQYVDSYREKHKFSVWRGYGNLSDWMEEIDRLVDWFLDPRKPINFGLYYNSQPDQIEHYADVEGSKVRNLVSEVDALIGYLIRRLNDSDLIDRMNIILTSDHGHSNVPDETHLFNLSRYLDPSRVIPSGLSYFPAKDSSASVQEIIRNLSIATQNGVPIRVWKKDDFPVHYHYKNNRRVGPVIVAYKEHYWNDPEGSLKGSKAFPLGHHGYLTESDRMRPFFVAYGPAFKKNFRLLDRAVQNIDLYPLMCLLLGIKPAPNNGSLDRIISIIEPSYHGTKQVHGIRFNFFIIAIPAVLLAAVFVVFVSLFRKKKFKNEYVLVPFNDDPEGDR